MIEIERKFIVDLQHVDLSKADAVLHIEQAYLLRADSGSTRVRRQYEYKFGNAINKVVQLTIKRKINSISNREINVNIDEEQFNSLLSIRDGHVINKTRYVFAVGDLKWELDVFENTSKGLVIAEVELPSMTYEIKYMPTWIDLTKEVSEDPKYKNVNLASL